MGLPRLPRIVFVMFTALAAACGGGGGGDPAATSSPAPAGSTTQVVVPGTGATPGSPAAPTAATPVTEAGGFTESVTALVSFLKSLAADESGEPVGLGSAAPPVDDTGEPAPVS
jgi:hypothetical protein